MVFSRNKLKTQKETVKSGGRILNVLSKHLFRRSMKGGKSSGGLLLFVFSERRWESGPPRVCGLQSKSQVIERDGRKVIVLWGKSVMVSWQFQSRGSGSCPYSSTTLSDLQTAWFSLLFYPGLGPWTLTFGPHQANSLFIKMLIDVIFEYLVKRIVLFWRNLEMNFTVKLQDWGRGNATAINVQPTLCRRYKPGHFYMAKLKKPLKKKKLENVCDHEKYRDVQIQW